MSFSPRMGRVQGCRSVLGWGEMFIHSHCMCAIVGVCIINHFLIASPPYPSPSIPFPTHPLSSPLFHVFHLQLSQGVRAPQPLHSAALHQHWWTGPLSAHQHANAAQGGGCGEDKAWRQAAGWGEAHDDMSHTSVCTCLHLPMWHCCLGYNKTWIHVIFIPPPFGHLPFFPPFSPSSFSSPPYSPTCLSSSSVYCPFHVPPSFLYISGCRHLHLEGRH